MLTKDIGLSKRQLSILLGDLVVLIIAPYISAYIYVWIRLGPNYPMPDLQYYHSFTVNFLTFTLLLYFFDQYNFQQDFRKWGGLFRIAAVVALGAIITSFIYTFLNIRIMARFFFVFYCTILFLGFTGFRVLYSYIGSVGLYDKKTLIVGCGDSGRALLKVIRQNDNTGINVIGFLEKKKELAGTTIDGTPVFEQKGSLVDAIRDHRPQLIIVAMRRSRYYELSESLTWCAQQGIEIWDVPTAFERLDKRIPLPYVDEMWLLFAAIHWPKLHIRRLKRIMDIVLSILGLCLASPMMVLIGLLIRLESRGPVLLIQPRMGKRGKLIKVYKFRSMFQSEPDPGDKGTCVNDSRVTRVGRVIRRLHFDELPQLFNVIKGDLSLVGPRAELYHFVREYIGNTSGNMDAWDTGEFRISGGNPEKCEPCQMNRTDEEKISKFIPYIEQRFTVDQGITGWAQIKRPFVTSSYSDMVKKLEYDLYYIKNMSIFLDLIILFTTARIVLMGKGK